MADGFDIDSSALRGVAPEFAKEAARLTAALTTLRSRLDACGAPWGDDKTGRAFAAQYLPHRPEIEKALEVLGPGLASLEEAVVAMADNHDGADQASIARP